MNPQEFCERLRRSDESLPETEAPLIVRTDGPAFLESPGGLIYVGPGHLRRQWLARGALARGRRRPPKPGEWTAVLVKLSAVNGAAR